MRRRGNLWRGMTGPESAAFPLWQETALFNEREDFRAPAPPFRGRKGPYSTGSAAFAAMSGNATWCFAKRNSLFPYTKALFCRRKKLIWGFAGANSLSSYTKALFCHGRSRRRALGAWRPLGWPPLPGPGPLPSRRSFARCARWALPGLGPAWRNLPAPRSAFGLRFRCFARASDGYGLCPRLEKPASL